MRSGPRSWPAGIADSLRPWTDLVGETIDRLLAGTAFDDVLPREDLTSGIAALFLGIELLTSLDPTTSESSLFATMESVAALIDGLLLGVAPAASTS